MKETIGIVGLGFVGSAVFEGMKHAFNIAGYDKVKGAICSGGFTQEVKDLESVVDCSVVVFVCVPTPMKSDGSCDTSIVEHVVNQIGEYCKNKNLHRVVVIKSTVVPGTTERLNSFNQPSLSVCFNPEFLTERNAINDFKNQDRIIIGGPFEGTAILKQVYETAYPNVQVTKTSSTIAELVKYTTNCFLAVKVAVANEIQQVCEKLNVDYDKVVEYATKDKRLGTSHWSVPGPDGKKGFGGSCFPKDINGFISLAESLNVECHTLSGAWQTNLEVRPDKDWEQLKGRAVV